MTPRQRVCRQSGRSLPSPRLYFYSVGQLLVVGDDVLSFDDCWQGMLVKVLLHARDSTPAGAFEAVATRLTAYV